MRAGERRKGGAGTFVSLSLSLSYRRQGGVYDVCAVALPCAQPLRRGARLCLRPVSCLRGREQLGGVCVSFVPTDGVADSLNRSPLILLSALSYVSRRRKADRSEAEQENWGRYMRCTGRIRPPAQAEGWRAEWRRMRENARCVSATNKSQGQKRWSLDVRMNQQSCRQKTSPPVQSSPIRLSPRNWQPVVPDL